MASFPSRCEARGRGGSGRRSRDRRPAGPGHIRLQRGALALRAYADACDDERSKRRSAARKTRLRWWAETASERASSGRDVSGLSVRISRVPSTRERRAGVAVRGRPAATVLGSTNARAEAARQTVRSPISSAAMPRRSALRSMRCSVSSAGAIGQRPDGEMRLIVPHARGENRVETDQRAVVAAIVRVVVALLLSGVHAVSHGRVEDALDAIDASHETPAPDENDRVTGRMLFGVSAAPVMPAGDVCDLDAVAGKECLGGQHGSRIVTSAHECPSPRDRPPQGSRVTSTDRRRPDGFNPEGGVG